MRYSTACPREHIACWGGESSVFNARTGDTHLLSVLPVEILRILASGPMDIEALAAVLAQRCATEVSAAWMEKLRGIVKELVRLELMDAYPE